MYDIVGKARLSGPEARAGINRIAQRRADRLTNAGALVRNDAQRSAMGGGGWVVGLGWGRVMGGLGMG